MNIEKKKIIQERRKILRGTIAKSVSRTVALKQYGVAEMIPSPKPLRIYNYGVPLDKRAVFLDVYKKTYDVLQACRLAEIPHSLYLQLYDSCEDFRQKCNDIKNEFADRLEALSLQEALIPSNKTERMFQLRALKSNTYNDKQIPAQHLHLNFKTSERTERQRKLETYLIQKLKKDVSPESETENNG